MEIVLICVSGGTFIYLFFSVLFSPSGKKSMEKRLEKYKSKTDIEHIQIEVLKGKHKKSARKPKKS